MMAALLATALFTSRRVDRSSHQFHRGCMSELPSGNQLLGDPGMRISQ